MIPLTFGLNRRGVGVANDLNPSNEVMQVAAFVCETQVNYSAVCVSSEERLSALVEVCDGPVTTIEETGCEHELDS